MRLHGVTEVHQPDGQDLAAPVDQRGQWPVTQPVAVEQVMVDGLTVTISARTTTAEARCPTCETVSRLRSGRYRRRLDDVTLTGRQTGIDLEVQRFRCRVDACPGVPHPGPGRTRTRPDRIRGDKA